MYVLKGIVRDELQHEFRLVRIAAQCTSVLLLALAAVPQLWIRLKQLNATDPEVYSKLIITRLCLQAAGEITLAMTFYNMVSDELTTKKFQLRNPDLHKTLDNEDRLHDSFSSASKDSIQNTS